jgi:hypothetical protein
MERLDREIGHLSVFDERYSAGRTQPATPVDGTSELITRRHGDVNVTYHKHSAPALELLRILLHALPRFLAYETDIQAVADVTSNALGLVDPDTAQAATGALLRMVKEHHQPNKVVLALTNYIFRTDRVLRANVCGAKSLVSQQERVVKTWLSALKELRTRLTAPKLDTNDEVPDGLGSDATADIEAGAMILLISPHRSMRDTGLSVLRVTAALSSRSAQSAYTKRQSRLHVTAPKARRNGVLGLLEQPLPVDRIESLLERTDLAMDQRTALQTWFSDRRSRTPAEMATGDHAQDALLWSIIFTEMLQRMNAVRPEVVVRIHAMLARLVQAFQPAVIAASGMSLRPGNPNVKADAPVPTSRGEHTGLLEQWRYWLFGLCCITTEDAETSTHSSKVFNSRDLLLLLTPYLSFDRQRFCEAAIQALGRIDQHLLPAVLRHLQKLQAHISDDPKLRNLSPSARYMQRRDNNQMNLFASISHVYMLVSPLVEELDLNNDKQVVQSLVDHINETYIYLADEAVKEDFELQRLRRYFCVLVKNVVGLLARQRQTEPYLSLRVRGAMFRLCDEWCTLGRRADVAKARESTTLLAAAERYRLDVNRTEYMQVLQADTKALSWAAGAAMAALCVSVLMFWLPNFC